MYFEIPLVQTVVVPPEELLNDGTLSRAKVCCLLRDFDKIKGSEEHGYYVTVTTLESIGEGKIWEGCGSVAYKIHFKCLVFKPYSGEKLLGEVTEVKESGFFARCGPLDCIYVSKKSMEGYEFLPETDSRPMCYKGTKDGSVIKRGVIVRLIISGLKWDSKNSEFQAIGSLNGNYLGVDPNHDIP